MYKHLIYEDANGKFDTNFIRIYFYRAFAGIDYPGIIKDILKGILSRLLINWQAT